MNRDHETDTLQTEDDVIRNVMAKLWLFRRDDGTYEIDDGTLENIIGLAYSGGCIITQRAAAKRREEFMRKVTGIVVANAVKEAIKL